MANLRMTLFVHQVQHSQLSHACSRTDLNLTTSQIIFVNDKKYVIEGLDMLISWTLNIGFVLILCFAISDLAVSIGPC